MPILVTERWNSRRWRGGTSPQIELDYIITGTDDDDAAMAAVLNTTPPTYANLYRTGLPQLERIGQDQWQATVTYGSPDEDPDIGLLSVDFEIGSQTTRIMQSLATLGAYPAPGKAAPNFYGAINVTADNVDGVDVDIPTYEWTETWRLANITPAYGATLYAITGKVNASPFRTFAPGEVLFRGATGKKTRSDAWELTYRFAASPNATNLTVGNITGITKHGWDYLWVLYEDYEDANASKLAKRPAAVYIEKVYADADFTALGIGN